MVGGLRVFVLVWLRCFFVRTIATLPCVKGDTGPHGAVLLWVAYLGHIDPSARGGGEGGGLKGLCI